MTNKGLLYSTEDYSQYSVIIYKGKKSEKEYTRLNHFAVHLTQTNTTL